MAAAWAVWTGWTSKAKCVQVDANSDPHPIHRRFAPVNRPPPFWGGKQRSRLTFLPLEGGGCERRYARAGGGQILNLRSYLNVHRLTQRRAALAHARLPT